MDPLPPQPPFPPLPTATITAAAIPVSIPTDASTLTPAVSTITTATAVTAEATAATNNHIAHAANPTPTAAAAQSANHPPYADMIYAAIAALKERDGSSKRAIAKYIEKAYTGLPATHPALLTHHLKRLKSSGLLEMVKKSYKLPGSRSDSDNITSNNNNSNVVAATTQSQPHPAVSATSLSGGPKRGRGRPPKPKSSSGQPIDYQPNNSTTTTANNNVVANSQPIMVPVGLSFTTQNIPPTAAANFMTQPNFTLPPTNPPNVAAGQVVAPPPPPAAIQLQQLGSKRGPGRPKKVVGGVSGVPVMVGKRRGRPPKSVSLGTKKSPGRPKKPKSVAANGIKKVPKRLPKSVVVPYATGGPAGVAGALNVPRPRGRPKKAAAVLSAAGGAVVVPARRPGRPPKVSGGIVKPKQGKPAGRPKKNVNVSWALMDQPQIEAYGDLKRKFEIFQSKVKQAVGVLKPQLTGETAISAVAELEGLASMDINLPLREEAQPQVIQS